MSDATTQHPAHAIDRATEASLRLEAAAQILAKSDQARALGFDPDDAARRLIDAAAPWIAA